jgi:uncharacterized protein YbjT (DUF2867 family)
MNILLFGATGMVGQGVMRECLRADDVTRLVAVGRTGTGQHHPRLREIVHPDLFDLGSLEDDLTGFDACFFCLGVSSAGLDEETYTRLTYDLTLAVASTLSRMNPHMTFVYVSGSGTDETEQGRSMWARVKGRTENTLRRLPFKGVYLFRPAAILPMHGEQSKTAAYRRLYAATGWLLRPLRRVVPGTILTTEELGRAMLRVARRGWPTAILEPSAIHQAAQG